MTRGRFHDNGHEGRPIRDPESKRQDEEFVNRVLERS